MWAYCTIIYRFLLFTLNCFLYTAPGSFTGCVHCAYTHCNLSQVNPLYPGLTRRCVGCWRWAEADRRGWRIPQWCCSSGSPGTEEGRAGSLQTPLHRRPATIAGSTSPPCPPPGCPPQCPSLARASQMAAWSHSHAQDRGVDKQTLLIMTGSIENK